MRSCYSAAWPCCFQHACLRLPIDWDQLHAAINENSNPWHRIPWPRLSACRWSGQGPIQGHPPSAHAEPLKIDGTWNTSTTTRMLLQIFTNESLFHKTRILFGHGTEILTIGRLQPKETDRLQAFVTPQCIQNNFPVTETFKHDTPQRKVLQAWQTLQQV